MKVVNTKLTILKEIGVQNIVKKDGTKINQRATFVQVQCECGTIFNAIKSKVVAGTLKTCGCSALNRTEIEKYASTAYTGMVRRCYGKELGYNREIDTNYIGVTVAEEWLGANGRENFIAWWKQQPLSSRLDIFIGKDIKSREQGLVNFKYSPETCTLVTKPQNMQATRLIKSNNKTGYRGVQVRGDRKLTDGKKFRAELRVNFERYNLGSYHKIEEAAFAVNHFISNTSALQPLNIVDTTNIDTSTIIANTLLIRSINTFKVHNP